MRWIRSLAAELFPVWNERRLIRRLQAESDVLLEPLERFRRRVALERQISLFRNPDDQSRHEP
jgi:hypothetical protein